jgi:hypothetical protein
VKERIADYVRIFPRGDEKVDSGRIGVAKSFFRELARTLDLDASEW